MTGSFGIEGLKDAISLRARLLQLRALCMPSSAIRMLRMVHVVVDADPATQAQALRGGGVMPQIINLNEDELSLRIQRAIESVSKPMNVAIQRIGEYEVEKITFSLIITASGEVSLMSMIKGGASMQSGIQVTLAPRKESDV